MRRVHETNAKRHHHVPVSYMRRFSPNGRHVFVLDRLTGLVRRDAPKNVAVESEFNTLLARDGRKQRWAEAWLGELDGLARPLLDKMENLQPLSDEERWYVSFFIGLADTRGRGYREQIHESGYHARLDAEIRSGSFLLTAIDPEEKLRFEDAVEAMSGVWLNAHTIDRLAREDLADVAEGGADIAALMFAGFELAQFVFNAAWVIVRAPPGSRFITSDRPLGLCRPGAGFAQHPLEPGILRLFPLSSDTALFIGDPTFEPFSTTQAIDTSLVRLTNVAILRRTHRFAIGSSMGLLRGVKADTARLAANK